MLLFCLSHSFCSVCSCQWSSECAVHESFTHLCSAVKLQRVGSGYNLKSLFAVKHCCYLKQKEWTSRKKKKKKQKHQTTNPLKICCCFCISLLSVAYVSASVLFRYPIKSHTDILAGLSLFAVAYDTDIPDQQKWSGKRKLYDISAHAVGFLLRCTLPVIEYKRNVQIVRSFLTSCQEF